MVDAQNLIEAAGSGDAERVQSILAAGFDVNTPNGGGETALIRAAGNGQADMVRLLVRHGADVNAQSADGMTPLIRAAFFGHPEAARVLMMRGADLAIKDRLGSTAIDWALAKGHDEVAETLSQPVPAEAEEETLIQQLPQAKPVEVEPQTVAAAQAEQLIEIRQKAPPPIVPQNTVAEVSPTIAAAEEAPEEELTIPREAVTERREKRAARAPRPPVSTPPLIGRQEIPIARPVEKSNRLHVVLTTIVIFLISGAVVYAITAGWRGAAINQKPQESSVDTPPTIADPTPAATPARNRTEAETQPATAFDAGATDSNTTPAAEISTPSPAASIEKLMEERRANNRSAMEAAAARTVRVVESRRPSPTRTPSRTERVVESSRNVREEENNAEQSREAAVRRPAVRESATQRSPASVSSPAPATPAAKKKVIQWP